MEELIEKYVERFQENFPLFLVRHLDEDEISALIRQCLRTGKVYDPDLDAISDY